jgi:hypothetical protein
MPKYRVLENGFFGGIFRTPHGRHNTVVTSKPFPKGKTPKWLEEVKEQKTNKAKAATVNVPNEKESDFMGKSEDGVETL